MSSHRWFTRSAATLLLTLSANASFADEASEWVSLFDGKTLAGWEVVDGQAAAWQAADGILSCTGKGGGWLSTAEQYDNFELSLEFRLRDGGNSGVFLRAPHRGDPAYTGMEVQVLDDAAKQYAQLQPWQYAGSIYGVVAAHPRVTKPAGQWQKMEIICQGKHVVVKLNGTQIVDADLAAHQDKAAEHPGILRTTGFLGLQNHSEPVEYREIKLRRLP